MNKVECSVVRFKMPNHDSASNATYLELTVPPSYSVETAKRIVSRTFETISSLLSGFTTHYSVESRDGSFSGLYFHEGKSRRISVLSCDQLLTSNNEFITKKISPFTSSSKLSASVHGEDDKQVSDKQRTSTPVIPGKGGR